MNSLFQEMYFKNLYKKVRPYTMSEEDRLLSLHELAREMLRSNVSGDFVECGVCNGGSAAILADAIRKSSERKIWLYDTFKGIPAAGPQDDLEAKKHEGDWKGDVGKVQEVFSKINFPKERQVVCQGIFEHTFKQVPKSVALIHIDADWYESVLLSLETFYPLIPQGGVIILDDFGWWEGCRKAFYFFCKKYEIAPLLQRVGKTQAYWIKGREHNRGNKLGKG